MSDKMNIEARLKAMRSSSGGAHTGLRSLIVGQEWAWRKLGLVLALMVALLIAALTLSPMPSGVRIASGFDKLYHFTAFLCLIFPLIVTDSRRWYWAVPLTIIYGGAIELIQPTVGRAAEWLDFGANVSGVLAGAALAELLHDRIRRSVFDADKHLIPGEDDDAEEKRLEAMRVELMDDLRVVLREELAAVPRPGVDAPVGPSPAEEADTPRHLRSVP